VRRAKLPNAAAVVKPKRRLPRAARCLLFRVVGRRASGAACQATRDGRSAAPSPSNQMTIRSDRWIRRMAEEHGMIEPFEARQVRDGAISYGLSSFGYDIRVGEEYKVFTDVYSVVVDPKAFDPRSFVDMRGDCCIIPPHSFALAATMEYFRIPSDVLVVCVGKSTYARCGIIVNVTPLEPEWCGHLTLEISNTTPLPAKIYSREGLAQLLFFQGDEVPEVTYAQKRGKYQDQRGVTLPRM
jgi:dCTP deaminase